jgi:anti-sigma factor RsiW
MTCRDATRLLAGALEGTLAPGVVADFERHLGHCGNCRRFLAQYRATIAAGRRAARELGASVVRPEELMGAVLTAIGARRP